MMNHCGSTVNQTAFFTAGLIGQQKLCVVRIMPSNSIPQFQSYAVYGHEKKNKADKHP